MQCNNWSPPGRERERERETQTERRLQRRRERDSARRAHRLLSEGKRDWQNETAEEPEMGPEEQLRRKNRGT